MAKEIPSWAVAKYSSLIDRTGFHGSWRSRAFQLAHLATAYGVDSPEFGYTFGKFSADNQILRGLEIAWDEMAVGAGNDER